MGIVAAIFLIISGLVMIGAAGNKVPFIGKYLVKVGSWLSAFAIIIGIVDLVIGILALII